MAKIQSVSEILRESELIPARDEKLAFFRDTHRNNIPLKSYLRCAFDPMIKFLLPKGIPAGYKNDDFGDKQSIIYARVRELYLFIEGGHPTLKQDKREELFKRFIESIDREDAELLCAVKDKEMPYRGITYDLVYEAYPGLLPVVVGMNLPQIEIKPVEKVVIVDTKDDLDAEILGNQAHVETEQKVEKKVDNQLAPKVQRGRPKKTPKDIPAG